MPPYPAGSWERLGELLVHRRVEIDLRYRNRQLFADERGLNWRLLYDIERAKRTNFEPETKAAIEVAYMLAPGSVDRVLAGGELEPQSAPDPAAPRERPLPPILADAPEEVRGYRAVLDAEREHGLPPRNAQEEGIWATEVLDRPDPETGERGEGQRRALIAMLRYMADESARSQGRESG
jgi:hypothetical protein